MHPIVKDYLEKLNIDSIEIDPNNYPLTPITEAIFTLRSGLLKKVEPAIAFAAAEKADQFKEENIELILIFLEIWFRFSILNLRHHESEAILNRIKKIPIDGLLPEFRIIDISCLAILKGSAGNLNEFLDLMLEACNKLPKQSTVYKRIFFRLCIPEACRGRLNKYSDQLSEIKNKVQDSDIRLRIQMIEFLNFAEQANYKSAENLLKILDKDEVFSEGLKITGIIVKNNLSIMHNYFEDKVSLSAKNELLANQPFWVQSTYYLLFREPTLALQCIKENIDSLLMLKNIGFSTYVHIRAELSSRNHEAARWLLQKKELDGNFSGFENFFLARIEILTGNFDKAKNYLRRLKEFVVKYGFEKRMEIELDLACELNINQYNRLMKECDQIESARLPIPSKITKKNDTPYQIIGKSDAIKNLKSQIEKLAPLNIPILITGETGTGKDLVARALHDASPRKNEPFIAVNCAAISENLLQSELFGYDKGAFTGALSNHKGIIEDAGNGTIFLDEIGDISQQLQIAFLRLLENGEYRPVGGNKIKKMTCRVIAATNAPLEDLVEKNIFRKDLYYRLERFMINTPPLRERKGDITTLSFYFLQSDRNPLDKVTLSAELLKALELNQWPGNIRELRNVIERMRFLNSNKLQFSLSDLDKNYIPLNKNMLVEDASGFFPVVNFESINSNTTGQTKMNSIEIKQKDPAENIQINTENRNHRRIETLKRMFQKYEKLSKTEAAKAINCSLNSISNDLNKLASDGYIKKIEPTSAQRTHYYQIIK